MAARKPPPAPAIADAGSVDAWERFLGARVEAGLEAFLEGLRADGLNFAQALEGEVRHWQGALAVALLEARRRGLDRSGLLGLHQRIQLTPPGRLESDVGIPSAILEEGTILLTRKAEFARVAAEAGVGDLLSSYREQEAKAALMGKSILLEASREEEHFRALVRDHGAPFRTQALYDRGDGASRVLLSLCLLRGYRMPEDRVRFIPPKAAGEGRSRTRRLGLTDAFLRLLPPKGDRPGGALVRHAGALGPRARERAYRAAARAIGLEHIPSRGEVLVRLLAAAGEVNAVAALAADARRKVVERSDLTLEGEGNRLPRHSLSLKARIKAVERECLRLLQEPEPSTGEPVPFSSLEIALIRSGQLLGKEWKKPRPGRPGATTAWRLADPRGEGVEDLPPPPRP
jgi:hypothetical protein